jgi:hypothetical protein
MARFNLKHAKAPNGLLIPVTVNVEHSDLRGTQDGEVIFLITLETGAKDKEGNRIDTIVVNGVTKDDVKQEIQKALAIIAAQIDWGELEDDTKAPKIDNIHPKPTQTDVKLYSHVYLKIRDSFPTSAIDPDSIKMRVNGIEVTDDLRIVGADTEYNVRWIPKVLMDS